MKVMLINAVADKSSSTGNICYELSTYLEEIGHECLTVYAYGKSSIRSSIKISDEFKGKMSSVVARVTGLEASGSYSSTNRIIRCISEYSPDIIHIHNIHSNYANLYKLLDFINSKEIPLVITLHDCWFYTGKCTHYSAIGCYKWQEHCGKCPKLREDIPSLIFDRTDTLLNKKKVGFNKLSKFGVIAVSDWILNESKKSILSKVKAKRIYNWVDTDQLYKREIHRDDLVKLSSKQKLLVTASSIWVKDSSKYKVLKKIANQVVRYASILLIGKTEDGLELLPNIVSVGYVKSKEKMAEYYSIGDCYLHLAVEDSFGKVIAEAMSCELPVLAFDTTVYPEIVKEEIGQIVPYSDIDNYRSYIEKLLSKDREQLGKKCREYVCNTFDKRELLRETVQFYRAIMEK